MKGSRSANCLFTFYVNWIIGRFIGNSRLYDECLRDNSIDFTLDSKTVLIMLVVTIDTVLHYVNYHEISYFSFLIIIYYNSNIYVYIYIII